MSANISAIRFHQWLPEWDKFEFDAKQHRREPDSHIYLFSLSAVQLRALSGVFRRQHSVKHATGLQRAHDEDRSETIREYVRFGYPYSDLRSEARSAETNNLKKPGWLPTAIVVNILLPDDVRRGRRVDPKDVVHIKSIKGQTATIQLPYANQSEKWKPTALEPLEVIDGQHRLWAFDDALAAGALPGDFELPVVAFHGLDIGWQAYLFWSINVSPKRINPSHAFDLYPLLRSQDWLEVFSDLKIYREARAQELTEILFQHSKSPWHNRINMLGETGKNAPLLAGVTQAGWVRALASTFLAPGGKGRAAKGFFSADIDGVDGPLGWSRPQQGALLIALWNEIREALKKSGERWVKELLNDSSAQKRLNIPEGENAFVGSRTMLNQEQGVRGVLSVANDVLFAKAAVNRKSFDWQIDSIDVGGVTTVGDVSISYDDLKKRPFSKFVRELARDLIKFDWRSADAPGLTDDERLIKRAFRGSGGYVALREEVMKVLAEGKGEVGEIARQRVAAREV